MTSVFSRYVLFFLFKAGLATLAFPRYSKFGPFSFFKISNISSLLSTFLGTSNVRVAGILCCRCLFKFNCVFRFWWTLSRSLYFTMLLTGSKEHLKGRSTDSTLHSVLTGGQKLPLFCYLFLPEWQQDITVEDNRRMSPQGRIGLTRWLREERFTTCTCARLMDRIMNWGNI